MKFLIIRIIMVSNFHYTCARFQFQSFNHVFNEIFGSSQDLPERQQCKIIDGGVGLDLVVVVPGNSVKSKLLVSWSDLLQPTSLAEPY